MNRILLFTACLLIAPWTSYSQIPALPVESPTGTAEIASWFAGIGGETKGPFTEAQIRSQITAGTIDSKTLIWKEGMSDWQAAGTNALFSPSFSGTPQMKPATALPALPALPPPASPSTALPAIPSTTPPDALPGGPLANVWLQMAEESLTGNDFEDNILKNASKDVIPPEQITLKKLSEIFEAHGFHIENDMPNNVLNVTEEKGIQTVISVDSYSNIIVFMTAFEFKPDSSRLDRLEFTNKLNGNAAAMLTAEIDSEYASQIMIGRTNYYDQGISEFKIFAKLFIFQAGFGEALAESGAEQILE